MKGNLLWTDAERKAFTGYGANLRLFARIWIAESGRWRVSTNDFVNYIAEEFDTHAEAKNFIEALWALEDCNEDD